MNSKKESLVILKAMLASFKEHIAAIEVLIEEAEFELNFDEKKRGLGQRIHEGLNRKIEKLEKEIALKQNERDGFKDLIR